MFKVGLTGGIGCGKTTVSNLFAGLKVPIVDADHIAHQLVQPGQPALLEITTAFGNQILNPDGSLNRQQLRDIVFSDEKQKIKLESILHPLVFTRIEDTIAQLDNAYCIVCIPLLFETKKTDFVDRILVIDCPVELQIERVKRRDGLSETRIRSILESQVSREFRLANANDVLDTTITGGKLAEKVKKLHNHYLSISATLGQTRL